MKIETILLGAVQTNCYIISNEETKECIIIDPSDSSGLMIKKLEEANINPVAILLTHGHFDHIMAGPKLSEHYKIPMYGYIEEGELVKDPILNAAYLIGSKFTMKLSHFFKDGDELLLAGYKIKVIHTPGHTKGSVCFYIEDEKVLISGDTLFYNSVGRTDLPTGDAMMLLRSIEKKLMALPEDTKVYPGHGMVTSIGYEKKNNPFIQSESIWD